MTIKLILNGDEVETIKVDDYLEYRRFVEEEWKFWIEQGYKIKVEGRIGDNV